MRLFLKRCLLFILLLEAKLVVRKYKPRIVAITGSVGKTSTKDAIYSVLAGSEYVRKSEKSFNSELGLPLTILGCPNAWNNPLRWMQNVLDGFFLIVSPARYPSWLVLEIGADRPGDITSVAKWLPIDVAVITHLPEVPVHVEFFDSPEEVIKEKAALINGLKQGGTLILYADDERTRALASRAWEKKAQVVSFGLGAHADVRGVEYVLVRDKSEWKWPTGMTVHISVNGASAPVSVSGVIGAHMLLPLLAAAAVGLALEKNLTDITRALAEYEPPHGRMHVLPGIKDTLLIDDTYNSSPAAVKAALEALASVAPRGRKIAVLGDMMELGRHSVDEHRKAGVYAAKAVDLLVTVGFRARDIAQGALDNGLSDSAILQYEDSEKAGEELAELLQPGDCVLLKGSQSTRMERAVEHLLLEPERAGELLVRQDSEWKKR